MPSYLTLSNYKVEKYLAEGSTIGSFNAEDPDNHSVFTFYLAEGVGDDDNQYFTVNENKLILMSALDWEDQESYRVRVGVSDEDGLFVEQQFVLEVIQDSEITLDENLPNGTIIGTFSSADPDQEGTFTYSLVDGEGSEDNSLFEIDGNQLIAKVSFDYEQQNAYSIRVRTTDQSQLFYDKIFYISVQNIPESPYLIKLSNNMVYGV